VNIVWVVIMLFFNNNNNICLRFLKEILTTKGERDEWEECVKRECVCVCVCERVRENKRGKKKTNKWVNLGQSRHVNKHNRFRIETHGNHTTATTTKTSTKQ
jgi:hypothetical protein